MTSVFSHNGTFTVTSLATGDHRTFKVRTQKDDSDFAPGERIVYYMFGPNNEFDFRAFGFVKDDRIVVWNRHRDGLMERYARMLEHLDEHEQAGRIKVDLAGACRRCNRKLTTPESIESGIGPVCEGRDSGS